MVRPWLRGLGHRVKFSRDRGSILNGADVETFIQMAEHLGYQFTEAEWREMTRCSVEEFKSDISEIPGI